MAIVLPAAIGRMFHEVIPSYRLEDNYLTLLKSTSRSGSTMKLVFDINTQIPGRDLSYF